MDTFIITTTNEPVECSSDLSDKNGYRQLYDSVPDNSFFSFIIRLDDNCNQECKFHFENDIQSYTIEQGELLVYYSKFIPSIKNPTNLLVCHISYIII